jgi:hypothetical protein
VKRYYDLGTLSGEIARELETLADQNGLTSFHPIMICAVLEVIASPLKALLTKGPLAAEVGENGLKTYYASRLLAAVEEIKSPHSMTVNPLMEAAVSAVRKHREVRESDLLQLTINELREDVNEHSIPPGFQSAIDYLQQTGIIALDDEGIWRPGEESLYLEF